MNISITISGGYKIEKTWMQQREHGAAASPGANTHGSAVEAPLEGAECDAETMDAAKASEAATAKRRNSRNWVATAEVTAAAAARVKTKKLWHDDESPAEVLEAAWREATLQSRWHDLGSTWGPAEPLQWATVVGLVGSAREKNKARAVIEIYRIPMKRGRCPWLTPL